MRPQRRQWLRSAAVGCASLPLWPGLRHAVAQAVLPEQRVSIVAQRFSYTPAEIQVRAGQPVLLEFSSLDFVHGFYLPALKLRADLPPGMVTRLRFVLEQPGSYPFLCDNFCGEGHEQMAGRIVASA